MTEMESRKAITDEALSWVGTPYHDWAGIKGVGVDCAFFPLRVYQEAGFIDPEYKPEWYSPQKWVNHPSQARFHVKFVDTTMLDDVKRHFKREILPPELPQPGDLMLCKVVNSWSHACVIIRWPEKVLHPVINAPSCVIGSHALKEGFWGGNPQRPPSAFRFFSMFEAS